MFSLKFTVIRSWINSTVTSGVVQGSDVATGSLVRVGENVGAYAINKGTYTYGTNYETYVSKDLTIGKELPYLRQMFSLKFTVIQILD
jgi:hypothetical protein